MRCSIIVSVRDGVEVAASLHPEKFAKISGTRRKSVTLFWWFAKNKALVLADKGNLALSTTVPRKALFLRLKNIG